MPPTGTRGGSRRAWAAAVSAAATMILVLGCSGDPTAPAAIRQSPLGDTAGAVVRWTTDRPARASVRYGFVSGRYDRLAYPAAAGGGDKAAATDHAVPLLEVPRGRSVFIRRVNVEPGGGPFAAPEETLIFAAAPSRPALLRFTSVDVQFGDALVLRCPGGATVLIDAGDPLEGRKGETAPSHLMRWLDDHRIDRFAFAAVTHAHRDHAGGFVRDGAGGPGVFDRYPIGIFLDLPAHSGSRPDLKELQARLDAAGVPRLVISPGMTAVSDPDRLGWDPALDVKVLHGGAEPLWNDLNNDSLVLRVGYRDVDFVTGGDCEREGEALILQRFPGDLAGVEVLKAGHHGRSDAGSEPFLAALDPRAALVTVAFVAYREGAAAGAAATAPVLERFAALGTDVFRFDDASPLDGTADHGTFWHTTLVTDGASYEIRTEPSVWGLVDKPPPGKSRGDGT